MWRPVGLVTKRNRVGSPALRRFLELLRSTSVRPKLASKRLLAN
jgi:hypothetical protein